MTAAAVHETTSDAPESQITRTTTPTTKGRSTLSQRILSIDWEKETPFPAGELTIVMGNYEDDAKPFMDAHFASIFGAQQDRFFVEPMTAAKRAFWDEMDIFVFKNSAGQTVGICTAHPSDWSTYYMRTIGMLPEYREQGFLIHYKALLDRVLTEAGVVRRETETSPANTPMNRFFFNEGAIITSMTNTERWGVLLKYTKYLNEDAEGAFRRQFINVPTHGRNPKPK